MKVGLSFDIEDFHQGTMRTHGSRVVPASKALYSQCEQLLKLLQDKGIKSTFFILGSLVPECSDLVARIHEAGHEVGIHGFEHCRVDGFIAARQWEDLRRVLDLAEGIIHGPVFGFRAPFFSLSPQTAWLLDTLKELGFVYDASLLPVVWKRSMGSSATRDVFRFSNGIYEIPITVGSLAGIRLLPCGGGYFRFLPYVVSRAVLAQQLGRTGRAVAYFHNYDFSDTRLELPLPSLHIVMRKLVYWLRMWLCARSCGHSVRTKIIRLLDDFDFCPLSSLVPAEALDARRNEFRCRNPRSQLV